MHLSSRLTHIGTEAEGTHCTTSTSLTLKHVTSKSGCLDSAWLRELWHCSD